MIQYNKLMVELTAPELCNIVETCLGGMCVFWDEPKFHSIKFSVRNDDIGCWYFNIHYKYMANNHLETFIDDLWTEYFGELYIRSAVTTIKGDNNEV